MAKRIMILATDGFEQSELEKPKQNLEDAGLETVVVAPQAGEIKGWKHTDWGNPVKVDKTVDEVRAEEFDAIVLPGGVINPDKLRVNVKAVQLVRDFFDAGKTVAAICHGPWMLVEADVVRGKKVTGWPSVRTDLLNAGGEVHDEECVEDGNLITSRKPDDIPAFSQAVIRALQKVEEPA